MLNLRFPVCMIVFGLMVLSMGVASGQAYPNKPIRIVTGAAGGSSDFPTRIIAQELSSAFGQPIVVDNRSGGTTLKSAELVAVAPADGYTLLVAGNALAVQPLLVKASYDPFKDFSPIMLISQEIRVFTVNPSLPVNSIKELIALAKAKPGALNYASGGIGGAPHIDMEAFKSITGINIVHIPYMGSPPAITALVSGEAQIGIVDLGLLVPFMKSGKLRALAIGSAKPSVLAPGLPTVAATVPGYESPAFVGMFAPAKTPGTVIKRLNEEVARYIKLPEVTERLFNGGEEVLAGTPEQLAAIMKGDVARKGKVIKDLGIKVE